MQSSNKTAGSGRCRHAQRSVWGLGAAFVLMLLAACAPSEPQAPNSMLATPQVSGKEGLTNGQEARETVADVASDAPNPAEFDALLATIGELSPAPLYKESRAELLIDGPATYGAMNKAIDQAQHSIYLETYIFADDEVGYKFAERLIAKAREGVKVCVIYDSVGSLKSAEAFFEMMEDAGVKRIEFRSINPAEGGNPLHVNNRDHRKILVVDDTVAFTGGINLSRTYSSASLRKPSAVNIEEGWRDTHIAVYGPAVEGFRRVFQEQWLLQGGAPGDVSGIAAPIEREGDDLIAVLQSEGGDSEESAIYRAYLESMDIARLKIWITQAYFAPDDAFMEQLKQAARRGVDVRILVPGISDSSLVLHASRSRYGELLSAGVKIYENTSSVLHAKTAVIDGIWSTVGSSNLDYRSFLHNDEINAVVLGTDFASQLESQFEQDIKQGRVITLQQWKKRPITDRVRELFSWVVNYWI